MSQTTPRADRRAKYRTKDTFGFYLERAAIEEIEALVRRGVYANASHAVDEAIARLLEQHRRLRQNEESADVRAA